MRGLVVGALCVGCGNQPTGFAEPPPACAQPTPGTTVEMKRIGQVSGSATHILSPPRDPRLFVLEQAGAIRVIDDTGLRSAPFLDLSLDAGGPVIAGGENGLLGMAFHPQYATNGRFFVTYTATNSGDPANRQRDVLARCTVSASDPNRADPASCSDVLSIPDFAANHNGGMIEFGADGFLYWATGDGGGGGDPNRNGQALVDGSPMPNTKALLGKMLRLDVDRASDGRAYGIPDDNPFAAGGGPPEVFMVGIRNAWRWTFDRATGDMWIADVGQDTIEELTVVRAGAQRGANLGWSIYEASACFHPPCGGETVVMPQDERAHSTGWASITGGQVYRGACLPDLVGTYFYTDYQKGGLAAATLDAGGALAVRDLAGQFPANGSSIHAAGMTDELFETDTRGNVYQLVVVP